MPKPDQKVSISAALQRPQRQKALPKPLTKNIETSQQPFSEEVEDLSQPNSELHLSAEEQVSEFNGLELSSKVNKAIAEKPKLKPKLKPVITDLELQEEQNIEVGIVEAGIEDAPEITESLALEEIEQEEFSENEETIEIFDPSFVIERSLDLDQNLDLSNQTQTTEASLPIFWCQAVGLLAAKYIPSPEAFQKGELVTDDGSSYKAFVLSKAIKALEKKTDLSVTHKFVVYPKTSKLKGVRLEILATDSSSKIEKFEDGQFNIRGFVTKQLENSFLIEIHRRAEYLTPSQNDRFTLEVKGDIPVELIQQFVYLQCQLVEGYLKIVSYEHLACPMTPKKLSTVPKPILKPKSLTEVEELDTEIAAEHDPNSPNS